MTVFDREICFILKIDQKYLARQYKLIMIFSEFLNIFKVILTT
jgi:hypothetical protein